MPARRGDSRGDSEAVPAENPWFADQAVVQNPEDADSVLAYPALAHHAKRPAKRETVYVKAALLRRLFCYGIAIIGFFTVSVIAFAR